MRSRTLYEVRRMLRMVRWRWWGSRRRMKRSSVDELKVVWSEVGLVRVLKPY